MATRDRVLCDLINFSEPVSVMAKNLGAIDWDFDATPIELNSTHLKNVLQRYIGGDLTSGEVEDWANLIEGREDIDFESNYSQFLSDAIYELANPELTEPLSEQRAKEIIQHISQA